MIDYQWDNKALLDNALDQAGKTGQAVIDLLTPKLIALGWVHSTIDGLHPGNVFTKDGISASISPLAVIISHADSPFVSGTPMQKLIRERRLPTLRSNQINSAAELELYEALIEAVS